MKWRRPGLCALPYLAESNWGIHVTPALGEVEYKGARRHLTPQMFRLFARLMATEVATREELYEALQPRRYDPQDAPYIRVYMSHLKRAIDGLPLEIETYSGFGYRLKRKGARD